MQQRSKRLSVWKRLGRFHRAHPVAAHTWMALIAAVMFVLQAGNAVRSLAALPPSVVITAPVSDAAYGGGPVALRAVSPSAERVDFILYSIFQPLTGSVQKTQISSFPAVWDLASSTWDGTFRPDTARLDRFAAYEVRALVHRQDGMEVLSNGVDFTETFPATSTQAVALAFSGNTNYPTVTLTTPNGGETEKGIVTLTANISSDAGQARFVVWDGHGFTKELSATKNGEQWAAAWDTRLAKDSAYWIEAEDITPSFGKFISYPVMVYTDNATSAHTATSTPAK